MRPLLLFTLMLAAPAVSAAPAMEANLRYAFNSSQGPPIYTMGQQLKPTAKPTETLRHGPYIATEKPRYLTATVGRGGDTTFTCVLDESAGTGTGYDRLFVDANNNEDLTDDPPILGSRRWGTWTYGPIPMRIGVDGQSRLYHARLEAQERERGAGPSEFWLKSLGYSVGEATFGAKRLLVGVVDANGNGVYGDAQRDFGPDPSKAGDMVLVDADKNGSFDQTAVVPKETLWCGKCIVVDGRFYELKLRADGSAMAVTPAAVKLASITAAYPRFALLLRGDHGVFPIHAQNGVARVPPGEYTVMAWTLEQRAGNNKWNILGRTFGEEAGRTTLKVATNGSNSFRLQAPLVAKVTPQKFTPGSLDFQLSLTTASGENVQGVTKDGRNPEEPLLRILDESGSEIAKLKFHYG